MPTQASVDTGRKITLALGAACAAIIAFTAVVIQFQLGAIDRGARVEARNLARVVAYEATLDDEHPGTALGEHLQKYVEGLHRLYRRDIVVVDARKRGLADADPTEIGKVFDHDPGDEVARTIKDGEVRLFVERNSRHPEGAMQMVVPRHQGGDVRAPIVGAVILEYTHIHQELLDATAWQIYSVGGAGLLWAVLVGLVGVKLRNALVRRLQEEKLAAEQIEYLASHDKLTGLANRGMFSRMLEQALQEARRCNRQLAVFFVDLDRFRNINDTLGHQAGDQLLQEMATRLRSCVREGDGLA